MLQSASVLYINNVFPERKETFIRLPLQFFLKEPFYLAISLVEYRRNVRAAKWEMMGSF